MVSYFPFFYLQLKKKIRQSQAKNKIIFNNYFTKDLTLTKTLLKLRVKLKTKEEKMKKYVLKKELPFAKIGDGHILELSEMYCSLIDKDNFRHPLSFGNELFREGVERLIEEGWIEEVNPREWWVVVDCQDGLSGDGTRLDQEQAESIAEHNNKHPVMDLKPYRAVKVREIIE